MAIETYRFKDEYDSLHSVNIDNDKATIAGLSREDIEKFLDDNASDSINDGHLQSTLDAFLERRIAEREGSKSAGTSVNANGSITTTTTTNTVSNELAEAAGINKEDHPSLMNQVWNSFTSFFSPESPSNKSNIESKQTSINGPIVNPYKDVFRKESTFEPFDIIGGADLTVFMLLDFPYDSREMMQPKEVQKKRLQVIEMDTVMSVSYNTIREKFPVRTLGRVNPKKYLSGIRTISGSIAFNVFTEDVLSRLRSKIKDQIFQVKANFESYSNERMSTDAQNKYENFLWDQYNLQTSPIMDEKILLLDSLPPFHLLIMGVNERGTFVKMLIKDIEILDESQYQGMQQPNIVNKVTFVAGDIVPMHTVGNNRFTSINSVDSIDESIMNGTYSRKTTWNRELSGSDLLEDLENDIMDKR